MNTESVIIFIDGSSRGNPGPGGFGAIIIADDNVQEIGGREEHTTNNRMELQAAIGALSFLEKLKIEDHKLTIYSDSSYVINGITKWVHGWQKNGWKTATKKEVENRDLWEKFITAVKGKNIEWKQVAGHVGVSGNERCDEIATGFADGQPTVLYQGLLSDYPIKNILNVQGNGSAISAKSSTKKHSQAQAYSYVSCVDGKVLTHKTWAECEARVKGRRAQYKKVFSANEESDIIARMSNQ